jgi:hypothetical protein
VPKSTSQFLAVLQKREEEHKERSFIVLLLSLDGHSEQLCDKRRLPQAVSFTHSLHLSFSHQRYSFISLQCSPGRLERKEAHSWFDQSFDESMVLFDKIVQIFALSEFTRDGKNPRGLQFLESFGVRSIFIDGDDAGVTVWEAPNAFAKKRLAEWRITSSVQ